MNRKSFLLMCGITGILGGLYLFTSPLFIMDAVTQDIVNGTTHLAMIQQVIRFVVLTILLLMGVTSAIKFKDDPNMSKVPSILLIIGSLFTIPVFLLAFGMISCVLGGAMFLLNYKRYESYT